AEPRGRCRPPDSRRAVSRPSFWVVPPGRSSGHATAPPAGGRPGATGGRLPPPTMTGSHRSADHPRPAARRGPGRRPPGEDPLTEHLVEPRVPRDLKAFIAGLPKAELHVHHVGS